MTRFLINTVVAFSMVAGAMASFSAEAVDAASGAIQKTVENRKVVLDAAPNGATGFDITVDGKVIGTIPDAVNAEFQGVYGVGKGSIVLVQYFVGNACPVQFVALVLSPTPKMTSSFGTCNTPESVTHAARSVTVVSPLPGHSVDQFMQAIPSKTEFERDRITLNGLIQTKIHK